ncbi:MAG: hypothetical protein PGN34_18015 [Methylobacterium frigidaeris]
MPDRICLRPSSRGRAREASRLAAFVSAVGRQSRRRNGFDPNDRAFDPDDARRLRRMPPGEFDRLLRDGEE